MSTNKISAGQRYVGGLPHNMIIEELKMNRAADRFCCGYVDGQQVTRALTAGEARRFLFGEDFPVEETK